jgi:hypothetical protein
MKIHIAYIIGFLVVFFLIWVLLFGGYGAMQGAYHPANIGATPAPVATAAPGASTGTPEPLQFFLGNNLAGGAISQTSILTVYTSANVLTDTLTTSSGAATTGTLWTPGQTGYVEIYYTGFVRECVPFTVPSVATKSSNNAPTYYIPLKDCTLGTFVIKCTDNFGNVYTTGQVVNFSATTLGGTLGAPASSVTLSFTVYNTASNTGYITTFDSLYNVNQAAGITMSTTGSSVSLPSGISGGSAAQVFPRGTSTYWSTILPDQELTNQKVGLNQVSLGQAAFSITVNRAALTHTAGGTTTNEQTFTINLVAPFDSAYFAANGVGGPNAVSPLTVTTGTFSLVMAV